MKEEDLEPFEFVRQDSEDSTEAGSKQRREVQRQKKGRRKRRKTKHLRGPSFKKKEIVARTREYCVLCAQKQRPLSHAEIAVITGYSSKKDKDTGGSTAVDRFVSRCECFDWVQIEKTHRPNGDVLRRFIIDEELKAICDDRRVHAATGKSVRQMVVDLKQEIRRRREEIQGRRRSSGWNPESTSRFYLTQVLDYIEEQFDVILDPDASAHVPETSAL